MTAHGAEPPLLVMLAAFRSPPEADPARRARKTLQRGASFRMRPMWRYTSRMSRDFRLDRAPIDVLNYEIAQEKAAALGRMGERWKRRSPSYESLMAPTHARARWRQLSRYGAL
jgi:hypothetical protein